MDTDLPRARTLRCTIVASRYAKQAWQAFRSSAKLADLHSSPVIAIHVGSESERQIFRIHQSLLTNHSTFFATMLKHDTTGVAVWREAANNIVNLPDDSPQVFQTFADYLYFGDALASAVCNERELARAARPFITRYQSWISAYMFADKIQARSYMQYTLAALEDFAAQHSRLIPMNLVVQVYDLTSPDSELRAIIVNDWIRNAPARPFDAIDPESLPPRFAADVITALLERRDEAAQGAVEGGTARAGTTKNKRRISKNI